MATALTSQHSSDLQKAESFLAMTPKYELSPSPTPQLQQSRSPTVEDAGNTNPGPAGTSPCAGDTNPKPKTATKKRAPKGQSRRKRSTPATKAVAIGKTSLGSPTTLNAASATQPKSSPSTPRSSTWTAEQKTLVMERVVSAGVSAINAAELAAEAGLTVTQVKNALQKGRSGNLRDRAVRSATS